MTIFRHRLRSLKRIQRKLNRIVDRRRHRPNPRKFNALLEYAYSVMCQTPSFDKAMRSREFRREIEILYSCHYIQGEIFHIMPSLTIDLPDIYVGNL